jgi:hypothetical protein
MERIHCPLSHAETDHCTDTRLPCPKDQDPEPAWVASAEFPLFDTHRALRSISSTVVEPTWPLLRMKCRLICLRVPDTVPRRPFVILLYMLEIRCLNAAVVHRPAVV